MVCAPSLAPLCVSSTAPWRHDPQHRAHLASSPHRYLRPLRPLRPPPHRSAPRGSPLGPSVSHAGRGVRRRLASWRSAAARHPEEPSASSRCRPARMTMGVIWGPGLVSMRGRMGPRAGEHEGRHMGPRAGEHGGHHMGPRAGGLGSIVASNRGGSVRQFDDEGRGPERCQQPGEHSGDAAVAP